MYGISRVVGFHTYIDEQGDSDYMAIDFRSKKICSSCWALPCESIDEQRPETVVSNEVFYGLLDLLLSNGFEEIEEY